MKEFIAASIISMLVALGGIVGAFSATNLVKVMGEKYAILWFGFLLGALVTIDLLAWLVKKIKRALEDDQS